jgi:type IV pilus assembly protein PilM
MNPLNFYRDESLFGLDIGHSSLKVMQLDTTSGKTPRVLGYGVANYPSAAVKDGMVIDQKALHDCLYKLLSQELVGTIDTRRVACTIPTSHTFSRPMKLPPMERTDLTEAVHLEAEQYIPIPIANLYIDYEISHEDAQGIDLLMVATPKNIIDSHIKFLEAVGLQPVALEPTMSAAARLFAVADSSHKQPSILVDFGSVTVDVAVFDQTMFVNSTIPGGSDTITQLLIQRHNVSAQEAYDLKNNRGNIAGVGQEQVKEVSRPLLDNLVHEIQKIVRYYNERQSQTHRKIVQIITIGGGANMAGLSDFFTTELHLPTRKLDPWHAIDFAGLPMPGEIDRSMYITVAGAATLNPKEVFA